MRPCTEKDSSLPVPNVREPQLDEKQEGAVCRRVQTLEFVRMARAQSIEGF